MNTKSLLTKKAILTIAAIASVAIFANLTLLPNSEAAVVDVRKHIYPTAEDIHAIVTFEFINGQETIDFPAFDMTTNLIGNAGPEFSVTGIVGENAMLHQVMDKAWEMRRINFQPYDWDEKYFDATVDFTKGDKIVRSVHYSDCTVSSIKVDTKTGKEDGFLKGTGFAYADNIGFKCAGQSPSNPTYDALTKKGTVSKFGTIDHGLTPYTMAEDVHAVATFTYKDGVEKIDFPYFKMHGTYLANKARPSFEVHGLVGEYPLLYRAVDNDMARSPGSTGTFKGQDLFNVKVEFVQNGKVLRGLNYGDCNVLSYLVDTQDDSEDSWTSGKTGFAIEDQLTFECNGLNPTNPPYDAMHNVSVNPTTTNSLAYKANQDFYKSLPNSSQ